MRGWEKASTGKICASLWTSPCGHSYFVRKDQPFELKFGLAEVNQESALDSRCLEIVDDLRIDVALVDLGGVGGTLATGGWRSPLRTGTDLPTLGNINMDLWDIDALEADGRLMDVILHEMGHSLYRSVNQRRGRG